MVFGRGFRGRYFWLGNAGWACTGSRKEKRLSQSRAGKPRIVIYLNGLSLIVYIYIW